MPVDRATVQHVARLARLELDDREADRLARDLDRMVAWVDRLAAVDTDGVEPMTHPLEGEGPRRPDVPRPSLTREAALANAPLVDAGGSFVVPPALPDEASSVLPDEGPVGPPDEGPP